MPIQDKSAKIRALEEQQKAPIESWLPRLVTKHGYAGTALLLNVAPSNIYNWIKRYGMTTYFVCLGPGEKITITRKEYTKGH